VKRLLLVLVVAAGLAGCSEQLATSAPVGCANAVSPSPLPAAWPAGVPLPGDAVVTGSEERSGGRLIVTAVAPGGFTKALGFMQKAYPEAGLELKDGEVESGDAESNFTGNGLTGRWTLREVPGCQGDTLVTVLVTNN